MNSPADPALIQLVQQELKSLQDDVKSIAEYCKEKDKVQSELQNCISVLEEMKPRMERLEICQQNTEREIDDVKGRINAIEDAMHKAEGTFKATMPIRAVQFSLYSLSSPGIFPCRKVTYSLLMGPYTFKGTNIFIVHEISFSVEIAISLSKFQNLFCYEKSRKYM